MAASPISTPKRKRSEMLQGSIPNLNTTTQFTFDLYSALEDGNASPRTRVAQRFHGLALGGGDRGGGGRTSPSRGPNTIDTAMEDGARKRIKLPDIEMRDADDPADAEPVDPAKTMALNAEAQPPHILESSQSKRSRSPKSLRFALDATMIGQPETSASPAADMSSTDTSTTSTPPTTDSPFLQNLPSHPKARTQRGPKQQPQPPQPQEKPQQRRSGTPPLTARSKSTSSTEQPTTITDPVRAALTWHDDEITIYDPDDSDDDGTGINGIGFKPTPAIAYARTMRRKQQLAEYRKREEREARAKRSQRRRGGGEGSPAPVAVGKAGRDRERDRRRVRFLERDYREIGGEREGLVSG